MDEKPIINRISTEKARSRATAAKVRKALAENPLIAAVRSPAAAESVLASPIQVVFIVEGNLFEYTAAITKLTEKGRYVFLHLDLIEGIGKDQAGLQYIADHTSVSGIISTKSVLLKHAAVCRLLTIQRIFLLDSSSIKSGVKLIEASSPDFIEVMPALIPKAITNLSSQLAIPLICGGMIAEKCDIINALNAGAAGVSVSNPELWNV